MISRYAMRLRKWMHYASGTSYQHREQARGIAFEPGQLSGYFNDLTGKADWPGETGDFGVPVVTTDTQPRFAFPIVIFQWGLGNWDRWVSEDKNPSAFLENARAAGRWAIENMTEDGGWNCWTGLRRPVTSPYSAMAQGQALSLLARLATVDTDPCLRTTAIRAREFLLHSGPNGLTRDYGNFVSFEEYPGETLKGVLNGWIFALMGLYDFDLRWPNTGTPDNMQVRVFHLARALPRYDGGYWSTYDLTGSVASPFYHRLHIHQLRAIAETFPTHAPLILQFVQRLERYERSPICRTKAVSIKVVQKLMQPTMGEMA